MLSHLKTQAQLYQTYFIHIYTHTHIKVVHGRKKMLEELCTFKRGAMDRGGSGVILVIDICLIFNVYAFIQSWGTKLNRDNGHRS